MYSKLNMLQFHICLKCLCKTNLSHNLICKCNKSIMNFIFQIYMKELVIFIILLFLLNESLLCLVYNITTMVINLRQSRGSLMTLYWRFMKLYHKINYYFYSFGVLKMWRSEVVMDEKGARNQNYCQCFLFHENFGQESSPICIGFLLLKGILSIVLFQKNRCNINRSNLKILL